MSDFERIALTLLGIVVALGWNSIAGLAKSAFAAWTSKVPVLTPPGVNEPVKSAKVSFVGAIDALAVVRNRLVETGCMDDKSTAAIEAVTHALVAGTDK
jgi:hypothetical protein